jgi:hypothetical protein
MSSTLPTTFFPPKITHHSSCPPHIHLNSIPHVFRFSSYNNTQELLRETLCSLRSGTLAPTESIESKLSPVPVNHFPCFLHYLSTKLFFIQVNPCWHSINPSISGIFQDSMQSTLLLFLVEPILRYPPHNLLSKFVRYIITSSAVTLAVPPLSSELWRRCSLSHCIS